MTFQTVHGSPVSEVPACFQSGSPVVSYQTSAWSTEDQLDGEKPSSILLCAIRDRLAVLFTVDWNVQVLVQNAH